MVKSSRFALIFFVPDNMLVKEIVKFLLKKGAKVIVIACHTASALAADFLRREFLKSFPNVVIDNFTKKNKNPRGISCKHYRCPTVVYIADILSHGIYQELFTKSFHEITANPKCLGVL